MQEMPVQPSQETPETQGAGADGTDSTIRTAGQEVARKEGRCLVRRD